MTDTSNVQQLPVAGVASRPAPKRIMRPCDYGLLGAVRSAEHQVGSVETYNRLCDLAQQMKAKIDAGQGRAAAAMWATDLRYIYPEGHK